MALMHCEPEDLPKDNQAKVLSSIIWDNKCGLEETRERFFNWCNETKFNASVQAKCNNIAGFPGFSELEATFREVTIEWYRTPKDAADSKSRGSWRCLCLLKPPVNWPCPEDYKLGLNIHIHRGVNEYNYQYFLKPDTIKRLSNYCDQQLKTSSFPIWAIVLIALLTLAVLASVAFLSWKYCSPNTSPRSLARGRRQSARRAVSRGRKTSANVKI